jgi:hypothetical protein
VKRERSPIRQPVLLPAGVDAATPSEAEDFARTPAADSSDANAECGAIGEIAWGELILLRR